MENSSNNPISVLEQYFGFHGFLEGQEEVVRQILSGQDGLVVMPTGGGKSLCFQLPALCMEGVALVVSPLIALMKDQVDGLIQKGVPATMINSTLSYAEQRERISRIRSGEFKLIYIAPERFRSESFMQALGEVEIALFAVDEAHCLSQWGHDFRPDYIRLGHALQKLGSPQCVAFTATATPVVRQDILTVLGLRQPFEIVQGFSRPNLSLAITLVEKQTQKYQRIQQIIAQHKTGIIYCATRKRVEEVSEMLHSWGVSSIAYHGGMNDQQREQTQEIFIRKQADVAVATNAFGMGIDRSDVRFVIHFEIPGSVEAYYQEAGRAGRDGEAAVCEMLFNYADTRTQDFFIEGANPSYTVISAIYQYLQNQANLDFEVIESLDAISKGAKVKNGMSTGSALGILVKHGLIERFDRPGQRIRGTRLLQPNVLTSQLNINREALEEKEKRDRDKLAAMVEMAYAKVCRQKWILEYFGEIEAPACGTCDICLSQSNGNLREGNKTEIVVLKKALSGVARMCVKQTDGWQGRFGRARVVQMLLGSKSQEILRNKLDQLSTYGVLKEEGSAYVNELVRSMHDAGLVFTQKGEYPLLTLSKRGEQVMYGKTSAMLAWPELNSKSKEKARSSGLKMEELGFDARLYAKLKAQRNMIAKRDGVPIYTVFPNKTLERLTRLRPRSIEAGMRIHGINEMKGQQYLPEMVQVICNYLVPR